jgi:2-methylisocitrate lyase-like PEP mutase family enzyme
VASYLADVRVAAGADIVINARIDTLLRRPHDGGEDKTSDILHRARLYLEAGVDCVYPIGLFDPAVVHEVVAALDAPVNANLHPSTTLAALADAGAARISVGPTAFRTLMAELRRSTEELLKAE